ncbi:MAG: hypothetical protein AAGD40_06635 [Pseudomonadota bacterium]
MDGTGAFQRQDRIALAGAGVVDPVDEQFRFLNAERAPRRLIGRRLAGGERQRAERDKRGEPEFRHDPEPLSDRRPL